MSTIRSDGSSWAALVPTLEPGIPVVRQALGCPLRGREIHEPVA